MFKIGPFNYNFKNSSKVIYCNDEIKINKGELVLITGASGSGKSTFLQMLKGIIPQYISGEMTGQILYNDNSLAGEYFLQNIKEIIFLFQNPFSQLIYPNVPDEFFFSMENFNYSHEQMDEKKEILTKVFKLDKFWEKKTTELSHGECQRLVLASLLAIDPKVILLDEPTAFLDPMGRADFYKWLKKIKGSQTIIVVDHHLDEVLHLADKVLHVKNDGNITESLESIDKENVSTLTPLISFHGMKDVLTQLTLSGVSFHYPDQKLLLKDVSMKISSGEIFLIKGENGKGKSTLFKIIAGLLKPQNGKLQLVKDGCTVSIKNHYKEIGFIFQNPETHFFYDTIEEELKVVKNQSNVKKLLDLFLKDINLKTSPFLLSEGEKRRLSILMTVFLDKSILLYDEPTFGQDEESISIIREMILCFKKMGKTQILISHNEKFIESLPASVFELIDGKLMRFV